MGCTDLVREVIRGNQRMGSTYGRDGRNLGDDTHEDGDDEHGDGRGGPDFVIQSGPREGA